MEEPGFFEGKHGLAGERTKLQTQAEFLTIALKERAPVENIEVRLGDFGEEGRALKRTEACSEGEVAGAPLLDGNPHITTPWDICLLVGDGHVLEKSRILQPEFTDFHHHFTEDIAGTEDEFAEDHRALGFGVTFDHDRLDVEFFALLYLVINVDVSGRDIRLAEDADVGLQVTVLTVKILDALRILIEPGGHKDHATANARNPLEQRRGKKLVARKIDLSDPVLATFGDRHRDEELVGTGITEHHGVLRDIHVEIALLSIIVPQLVQVVFELVVLKTARTREPREHPPFLRLHLTFQLT